MKYKYEKSVIIALRFHVQVREGISLLEFWTCLVGLEAQKT